MEPTDYVDVELSGWDVARLRAAGLTERQANDIFAEIGLRMDLEKYLHAQAERIKAGESISMEEIHAGMNKIALEKYGVEYGLPLPSFADLQRPMIMARGTPLAYLGIDNYREYHQELMLQNIPVTNSWIRLRDVEVCVVPTTEGPYAFTRFMAGSRMRKLVDGMLVRAGAQTAERELKAMAALEPRLGKGQWDSYVLNGAFPEKSKRSDLHYIFRKGFPTIALSYHGYETGRVIACLCLHPYGYYYGTFTGLMCPTDEVIAHLLLMRADEHAFWKNSGQWPAYDPRSGL